MWSNVALVLTTLGYAYTYKHFQLKIPNGEMVPHPCKSNFLWRGVGHENHLGGGARNQFGVDFKNNNYECTRKVAVWARSVSNHLYWCAACSEGDGRLLKDKLVSILNHVANIHEGHGAMFPRCAHTELQEQLDWMPFSSSTSAEDVVPVRGRGRERCRGRPLGRGRGRGRGGRGVITGGG